MSSPHESVLTAWRINARTTAFPVERLPGDLWPSERPRHRGATPRGSRTRLA